MDPVDHIAQMHPEWLMGFAQKDFQRPSVMKPLSMKNLTLNTEEDQANHLSGHVVRTNWKLTTPGWFLITLIYQQSTNVM